MASPVESRAPSTPSPAGGDWTVQIADTIESVVGSVSSKTVIVETAARGLVYGVLILVMASAAMTLLTVALVRILDNAFRIWAVYAILGGVFTVVGLFLWRMRRPRAR